MRKLMIHILDQHEFDYSEYIDNPTSKRIYKYMEKDKTYTNKLVAQELNIPLSTVTGRVSDLVIKGFLAEHRAKPGTTLRGFKKI